MADDDFGVPPCTCTKAPPRPGVLHQSWIIDSDCPKHGKKTPVANPEKRSIFRRRK